MTGVNGEVIVGAEMSTAGGALLSGLEETGVDGGVIVGAETSTAGGALLSGREE